ncbi:MAG: hypothetical protein DYG97_15325 [Ignavibacteria bacterium CHB3]|nr:hypothetical protein [Ignavibacteria bacterium CHB3]
MKLMLIIIFASVVIFSGCESNEKPESGEQEVVKTEPHIAQVIDKIPGETVYFSRYMVMQDFKSDNINKSFDEILFVEDARKSPTPEEMKNIHSGAASIDKQSVKIEPLKDGKTVQQIFTDKSTLEGQTIKVKGKVVKFNKQIMKRNWIHLQDGTGTDTEFDLVLTSNDDVSVGDIIIAEGKVAVNKDFGAGYYFPVIIEDAKISKE